MRKPNACIVCETELESCPECHWPWCPHCDADGEGCDRCELGLQTSTATTEADDGDET